MTLAAVILFVLVIVFSAIAIGAFGWAAKTGQFSGMNEGSRSIFGADEPIGRPTDRFPGSGGGRALPPPSPSSR